MSHWTNVTGIAVLDGVTDGNLKRIKQRIKDVLGKMNSEDSHCPYGIEWSISEEKLDEQNYCSKEQKYRVYVHIIGDLEGYSYTRDIEKWARRAVKKIYASRYIISIKCPYFECPEEDRYIIIGG